MDINELSVNPKHWAFSFVRIHIVGKMQKKHSLGRSSLGN